MVSFDIQYAEDASLLLDLRILAKTVPVVLRRQGVA
jgi:lipopolysaccharide/colanic/teichoic acid biosynthesis glycosyltransferase